jgi:hypothetical protein
MIGSLFFDRFSFRWLGVVIHNHAIGERTRNGMMRIVILSDCKGVSSMSGEVIRRPFRTEEFPEFVCAAIILDKRRLSLSSGRASFASRLTVK